MNRYLRKRRHQDGADNVPQLWLSSRQAQPLKADGIKRMLSRRGRQAGLTSPLHAHRFRHDFSHRWQEAGGSETGLMAIAGWTSRKMLRHYGRIAQQQRALAEQSRLSLVDKSLD